MLSKFMARKVGLTFASPDALAVVLNLRIIIGKLKRKKG